MAATLQTQLVEVAGESARLAGHLQQLAETPPESAAPTRPPTTRAPRAPKVPASTLSAVPTGEEVAEELANGLRFLFPGGEVRVAYLPPTIWIDYAPVRLKLAVRHQHGLEALGAPTDDFMVEQSAGPRGLFRAKTGTAREVVDYIGRFFKRLRAAPPAAPAGGKRRHSKPKRPRAKLRRAPTWPKGIHRMTAREIAAMFSGKVW